MAFYFLGESGEARVACEGLLAAADATDNPATACFVLLAHGLAYVDADPVAAYDALRRGLTIARDSGNRQMESALAVVLCMLAATAGDLVFGATRGDPIDAFDYLTVTIRRYHDSGNLANLHNPLAILAAVFDRLGHHEQAATRNWLWTATKSWCQFYGGLTADRPSMRPGVVGLHDHDNLGALAAEAM